MKLDHRIINSPFKYPFTISKGTKTHQPAIIVQLEFMGFYGYGEAPAISYYDIPVEKMEADLLTKKRFIEQFTITDPERFWHFLHHLLPANPFLVCALDMAGWDLYGKMKRKSLQQLWGTTELNIPLTDYTIGIDTEVKMLAKMKEKPWPIYKIKVGDAGDMERVATIRKHTDAIIMVDANAGWSVEEALTKIPQLKALGVTVIEQPLSKDDWEGMKKLMQIEDVILIADETCVKEEDVERCVGYFHGINIKLTKCSGITPARRMITVAREKGMKIMLGCMNETTIGSGALLQLAAGVDYLDADGPLLLTEDTATGLTYNDGILSGSGAPGLGIEQYIF